MFSFERENKNINNPLSFIYTGCAPCPELSFHCRTWKNITADKTIIKKTKIPSSCPGEDNIIHALVAQF